MTRFIPVTRIKTKTQTIIVTPGGEVQDEKLTYDLPEVHPTPTDETAVVASVSEDHPTPVDTSILGVLLLAEESHPVSADSVTLDVTTTDEVHPASTDDVSVIASVSETHPVPLDEYTFIATVLDEIHPTPTDDVSGTEAVFQINETHPVPQNNEVTFEAVVSENHPVASDSSTLEVTTTTEVHPVSVEDVSGTEAIFQINETHPVSTHDTGIGLSISETHVVSTTTTHIEIDVQYLWPDTTVSNTGWTNPANMADKSTTTAATGVATSSGTLGTGGTQNTTSVNGVWSMPDMNLGDLTIDSVVLDWSITGAQSGVPLTAGKCNIAYDYSLNDGSTWTNFYTQTALNDSTSSLPLGAITAAQINGLRVRGVGSVLSGTGLLPVTTTASFFFTRARITAHKDY